MGRGRCRKRANFSFFLLETTINKRNRGVVVSAILLYAYIDNLEKIT